MYISYSHKVNEGNPRVHLARKKAMYYNKAWCSKCTALVPTTNAERFQANSQGKMAT